jgi:hypothetical protein
MQPCVAEIERAAISCRSPFEIGTPPTRGGDSARVRAS